MTSQPLLSGFRFGALDLPNRVVMVPMTRGRATNPEPTPTDLHSRYYVQRAGSGLIITEGTWVNRQSVGFVNVPGMFTPEQTAAWSKVTAAVHDAGGRIFAQLGHVGAISHPDHHNGELPVGASTVDMKVQSFTPEGFKDTVAPRALSTEEIGQTVLDYRTAALNAKNAGFDGMEIHAQANHFLPQFLSEVTNTRTDRYGGSVENRARLLFEVIAVSEEVWAPGGSA